MKAVLFFSIASLSASLVLIAFSSTASAQAINVIGDLFGTATGTPLSVAGTIFTQPISITALNGTLVGDVIVSNNASGNMFDLTITNLTYNCLIPNASGAGDVVMIVSHTYQVGVGPGPYIGSQSLSGTNTSGPLRAVQLDSVQDFGGANLSLPSLLSTAASFSLGPVTSALPAPSSNLYSIQATLRLHTDGTGVINLPSSAHVSFSVVPEPTALGFVSGAMFIALRRRRSKPTSLCGMHNLTA